jgi:class 3 adenylate cyclase/pimeloyl-ACP methyl ester carboxylesterase
VINVPEVQYAQSGDVSIAWQQFGTGPHFVGLPPFAQNLELMWEEPNYRRFLERLGSFVTVTHFDKRGTGLSERIIGVASLEERMDDFRAVMDAAGLDRAAIGGVSEGGPLAILFAATYPERVDKLLVYGSFATMAYNTHPEGARTKAELQQIFEAFANNWGTPETLSIPVFCPSMQEDAAYRKWFQRYERQSCTPNAVRQLLGLIAEIDVRSALPLVQAPTMVLHRTGDRAAPIDGGRYIAEHIDGATFVELPGNDHVPWTGDCDAWLDSVQEFLCGELTASVDAERTLKTVVFTDIVGSTEHAGELGDRRWHDTLDRHDQLVRRQVDHQSGRLVKTTGDGALAIFDSPGRALRAAMAVRDGVRSLGIEVRAGAHSGEVELRGDDVAGMAVHIASRVSALAAPSEVLVSRTVCDLVLGSEFRFAERGDHKLKGVDGEWRLLAVRS